MIEMVSLKVPALVERPPRTGFALRFADDAARLRWLLSTVRPAPRSG